MPEVARALGPLPEHQLTLALAIAEGALAFERARFTSEHADVHLDAGRFVWNAAHPAESLLDLDLAVDIREGLQVRSAWQRPFAGRVTGGVQLDGPLNALVGRADLAALALRVQGRPVGRASLLAAVDGRAVHVERLSVQGPLGRLEASGSLALADAELGGVAVELEVPDLGALGLGEIRGVRAASGALRLRARLDGPLRAPRGELALEGSALELERRGARALAIETARLGVEGAWPELAVRELELSAEAGRLTAAGTLAAGLDPARARLALDVLVLERGEARLALAAPCALSFGSGALEVEPLELVGTAGRALLALRGGDGGWQADLEFDALHVPTLLGPLVPAGFDLAALDGRAHLELAARELSGSAALTARGLVLPGDARAAEVALELALAPETVAVDALHFEHPAWGTLDLRASLPLAPFQAEPLTAGLLELELDSQDLDLAALAALCPGRWRERVALQGSASLSARLDGPWEALTGTLAVHGPFVAEVEPPAEGWAVRGETGRTDPRQSLDALREWGDEEADRQARRVGPAACDVELEFAERETTLRAALEGDERLSVELAGRADGGLDLRRLARDPRGWLRELEPEWELAATLPNLSALDMWVSSLPQFRGRPRLSGVARLDLRGRGPLLRPELAGELALEQGGLRIAPELPDLDALAAVVEWSGRRATIRECTGELAASPFELAGSIDFSERAPVFDLTLAGENLLLARRDGMLVRADAELEIGGTPEAPTLGGSVRIVHSRYTRPFEPLSVLRRGENDLSRGQRGLDFAIARTGLLARLQLDLAVRSDEEGFALRNNLVNGSVRPDLIIRGSGRVPLFIGHIYVDPTRVRLPAGTLRVRSGTITFQENQPFVPVLEISAEAVLSGYLVEVQITGDYDRPEVILSSTPDLPHDQLLALFLTGNLPAGDLGESSAGAAQTMAVYLAVDFVQRLFGGDGPAEDSLTSRLEFGSGIDPARTGVETFFVRLRLRGDPDGGLSQYLTGEQDAYEEINFGYRFVVRFR